MNRAILVVIIFVIMAIWFSALANACAPSASGGGFFVGPGISLGGGGWNRGGWSSPSSGGSSSSSSPSRSSGGIGSRGGGISGGSGGK